VLIRPAAPEDARAILAVIEPVIRAGETYALARDMPAEALLAYWLAAEHETFVSEEGPEITGTYYMRPNQKGGGAHVANCGYMTAAHAYGRGIARAMCMHSIAHAKTRGFKAMQFNFVVSTNTRAVQLWQSLGFNIAGRLSSAFLHPLQGYVDAYVMYRQLE
jgi:ribosomal protein S18 acetylase RimI-like enzyme